METEIKRAEELSEGDIVLLETFYQVKDISRIFGPQDMIFIEVYKLGGDNENARIHHVYKKQLSSVLKAHCIIEALEYITNE